MGENIFFFLPSAYGLVSTLLTELLFLNSTDRTSVLHAVVLTMYGVNAILSGLCASRAHTSIYFFSFSCPVDS